MFQRLLLAIDDSPASEVATVFAAGVAQRTGASVHVFHVNERQIAGRGLTVRTSAEAHALVTAAVELLRSSGVQADGSGLAAGYRDVPKAIATVAQERGANAIIIGSHRQRRRIGPFGAQVRERTTRRTSLPILTAPSPLKVASVTLDEVMRAVISDQISPIVN